MSGTSPAVTERTQEVVQLLLNKVILHQHHPLTCYNLSSLSYIMLYVLCSWEKVLKVGKDYPVKYDNYLIILMTYPLNSLRVIKRRGSYKLGMNP